MLFRWSVCVVFVYFLCLFFEFEQFLFGYEVGKGQSNAVGMNFLHKVSWKLEITKWLLLEEFIIFNYRTERVNSVGQIPLSFNLIYCRINKLRWHDSLCNSALSEESRYEKCTYEVFENKQTRPLFCLKKKLFFFFVKAASIRINPSSI